MLAYDTLLKAVQALRIFKRNKKPLETKIVACLLYMSGLSYRGMTYQTGLIGASHVAVHCWVRSLRSMASKVKKRKRRVVAMDKTKLKLQGREVFIWAAIDIHRHEGAPLLIRFLPEVIHQHDDICQEGARNVYE